MINNLTKIRRDARVILESMSIEDITSLGWSPDKIIEVTWNNDGRLVSRRAPYGVLARTLTDRQGVVMLEDMDDTDLHSRLLVLNADGAIRLVVPNAQLINGQMESGVYCWYEPARYSPTTHFGVVFRVDRDQALYQVDIDANEGSIGGIYPLR